MSNIKWGAIQPLTGGMYIGTEKATSTQAEWIISYPVFSTAKLNKEGKLTDAGNEYNLTDWFYKNGKSIPYYDFDRQPFDTDLVNYDSITINSADGSAPDFTDMDLVVAVPVCSGLSMVTSGKQEMKDARNCNMLFLAKYAMNVIKPKIYIFENAPTLMGDRGIGVRKMLEDIALEAGYSVLYYKTDTCLHDNCQKRPRTFIIFQKWTNGVPQLPHPFGYENKRTTFAEYMSRIPADATQQIEIPMSELNIALLEFAKHLYGVDWRLKTCPHFLDNVDAANRWDEFTDFVHKLDCISDAGKDKIEKFIRHAQHKRELGLNYMSEAIVMIKDTTPSIQFKSMQAILHPFEDRLLTIRECLHLMGMPHDFELHGDVLKMYPKIGQNVPVRTAQWIASEAIRVISNWDSLPEREEGKNVLFIDNIKQVVKEY